MQKHAHELSHAAERQACMSIRVSFLFLVFLFRDSFSPLISLSWSLLTGLSTGNSSLAQANKKAKKQQQSHTHLLAPCRVKDSPAPGIRLEATTTE